MKKISYSRKEKPLNLKQYANISDEVAFIGQGFYFQIWEPKSALIKQKESKIRLISEKKSLGSILIENKSK